MILLSHFLSQGNDYIRLKGRVNEQILSRKHNHIKNTTQQFKTFLHEVRIA